MLLGTILAITLSFLSYFTVSFDRQSISPRKQELWRAESTIFLTQPGFPAGRTEQPLVLRKIGGEVTPVPKYAEPGRFAGLAALYARLANSDRVRQRTARDHGPLKGDYVAAPVADTTYGAASPLPMITMIGTGPTGRDALQVTAGATETFLAYFAEEQDAAEIPVNQRVQLRIVNAAGKIVLLDPRKKTLPIVVFLSAIFATIALAFVLDNARPSRRILATAGDEDAGSPDVRRLA
jgi:hypothetical protein